MAELVDAPDGRSASVVGVWAKEKHDLLGRYVDICRSTRLKYLPPQGKGATYIDLFCGSGMSQIRETKEWVDGGAVVAWKKSVEGGAPFSRVIIGDADHSLADACAARLRALGARVDVLYGEAKVTAFPAIQKAGGLGLHIAFLDPFNLEALHFDTIQTLAKLQRVDIMIHVSSMDLTRNLAKHLTDEDSAFDSFAPGWRDALEIRSQKRTREDLLNYWRGLVAKTGVYTSDDVRMVRGSKNQRLYWLLLAARHDLAHRFWSVTERSGNQTSFDF